MRTSHAASNGKLGAIEKRRQEKERLRKHRRCIEAATTIARAWRRHRAAKLQSLQDAAWTPETGKASIDWRAPEVPEMDEYRPQTKELPAELPSVQMEFVPEEEQAEVQESNRSALPDSDVFFDTLQPTMPSPSQQRSPSIPQLSPVPALTATSTQHTSSAVDAKVKRRRKKQRAPVPIADRPPWQGNGHFSLSDPEPHVKTLRSRSLEKKRTQPTVRTRNVKRSTDKKEKKGNPAVRNRHIPLDHRPPWQGNGHLSLTDPEIAEDREALSGHIATSYGPMDTLRHEMQHLRHVGKYKKLPRIQ